MHISSYGITHQGKVRRSNQDAFLIDDTHKIFAVADGLGGLPGGAEASKRIIELIKRVYKHIDADEERADLSELVIEINRGLTKEGNVTYPATGFGSTLTMNQLIGDQLFIAHVGDSATYHLHDDNFNKLTTDHTMEQNFIERIGQADSALMPPEYSHTLTRCVGQNQELQVDQSRCTIASGDRLLLCTDGLNKVVKESKIHTILKSDASTQTICQRLVGLALAEGGPDNITAVVACIQ